MNGARTTPWSFFVFRNSTRFGVWVTYMNGTCTGAICYAPPPPGPKGQISLNLNYKVNFKDFQRFLNQTHKWKIYNISDGIFIRPPGSYPGVGLRSTVGVGGSIFLWNQTRFSVWVTHMNGTCTGTFFWVPAGWGLGKGSKKIFFWTWSCGISN